MCDGMNDEEIKKNMPEEYEYVALFFVCVCVKRKKIKKREKLKSIPCLKTLVV